jgi:hypothetical protein
MSDRPPLALPFHGQKQDSRTLRNTVDSKSLKRLLPGRWMLEIGTIRGEPDPTPIEAVVRTDRIRRPAGRHHNSLGPSNRSRFDAIRFSPRKTV